MKSLAVGFYQITDDAIDAIALNCPNLEELHAVYNEVYTFGKALDPTQPGKSLISDKSVAAIHELKKLHTLNLSLSQLSDRGVKEMLKHCRSIRHLELNCCPRITEESLIAFMRLARQVPQEQFTFLARNSPIYMLTTTERQVKATKNLQVKLR